MLNLLFSVFDPDELVIDADALVELTPMVTLEQDDNKRRQIGLFNYLVQYEQITMTLLLALIFYRKEEDIKRIYSVLSSTPRKIIRFSPLFSYMLAHPRNTHLHNYPLDQYKQDYYALIKKILIKIREKQEFLTVSFYSQLLDYIRSEQNAFTEKAQEIYDESRDIMAKLFVIRILLGAAIIFSYFAASTDSLPAPYVIGAVMSMVFALLCSSWCFDEMSHTPIAMAFTHFFFFIPISWQVWVLQQLKNKELIQTILPVLDLLSQQNIQPPPEIINATNMETIPTVILSRLGHVSAQERGIIVSLQRYCCVFGTNNPQMAQSDIEQGLTTPLLASENQA